MESSFSAAAVAAALGISVNTVYRAIHHTGQVKPATQRRILDYIRLHYPSQLTPDDNGGAKTITVITQIKPEYYWQTSVEEMRLALNAYPAGALRLRTFFYAGLRNEPDLLDALAHLDVNNTDALIVTPVCSERSQHAIAQIAEQMPVVVFNEYGDFGQSCLTHGNGIEEGKEAANLTALSRPAEKRVLILRSVEDSRLVGDRIAGYRAGIERHANCVLLDELDISGLICGEYNYNTTMSAQLARQIADYLTAHPTGGVNCIYIPDGLLAPLCTALVKLGRTDIRCFGHEYNDSAKRYFESTIRGGYIRSDIRAQSRAAIGMLASRLLEQTAPETGDFITPFSSCLIESRI